MPRSGARLGSLLYSNLLITRLPVRTRAQRHEHVHLSGPGSGTRTPMGRDAGRGRPVLCALEPPRSSNTAPHCTSVHRSSAWTSPRPGDELPSSEGMVDNRSQIYSRSQASQVPTARTTRRCWRSGLLWDFTKQTEQLDEECAAPGMSSSPSPGPQAGRSRGLRGLQDSPDALLHVQGDAE